MILVLVLIVVVIILILLLVVVVIVVLETLTYLAALSTYLISTAVHAKKKNYLTFELDARFECNTFL